MEAIGFAAGVAGLVGTFIACIECFDYIRLGRNLGEAYETAIIKLDFIRLRLTRWGTASGIGLESEEVTYAHLKNNLGASDKEYELAKNALGKILALFEKSAEKAQKSVEKLPDGGLHEGDGAVKGGALQDLHVKMRSLAIKRQKQSKISQKISWALYRKRDFDSLIGDLTDLVSELVELFPAREDDQQKLCEEELTAMNSENDLLMLDQVLNEAENEELQIDDLLHNNITKIIEQRKEEMIWQNNEVGAGSTVQQGNAIGNNYCGQLPDNQESRYVVKDSTFGTTVKFHQGHSFGKGS